MVKRIEYFKLDFCLFEFINFIFFRYIGFKMFFFRIVRYIMFDSFCNYNGINLYLIFVKIFLFGDKK